MRSELVFPFVPVEQTTRLLDDLCGPPSSHAGAVREHVE